MGWSIGFDEKWQRDIGYGVPAWCDFPGCNEEIDRGLSYVCCSQEPHGGDGCGLYFCEKHHPYFRGDNDAMCSRCFNYRPPFKPKPEHPRWLEFKATDDSWAEWRKEQAETQMFEKRV